MLDQNKRALAVNLYHEKQMPITKICTMMGISKPTLHAYVKAAQAGQPLSWARHARLTIIALKTCQLSRKVTA